MSSGKVINLRILLLISYSYCHLLLPFVAISYQCSEYMVVCWSDKQEMREQETDDDEEEDNDDSDDSEEMYV